MKDLFKRTKMMDEASKQGRKLYPAIELLIFMAVYMAALNIQTIILSGFSMFYFYSDAKLLEIFSSKPVDLQAMFSRCIELLSIAPEWLNILSVFLTVIFAVFAII